MRRILNFNSFNLLRVIFVVAVFILLFISSISYKHNRDTHESSKLLMHAYEVNIQLERLISNVKDAETGQSGFIITKNERYLTPYNYSRDRVNSTFIELQKLSVDNVKQQHNLKNLFKLINQRYDCFEQTLKFSSDANYDKRRLENSLFRGRILMENIRFQVDSMKDTK